MLPAVQEISQDDDAVNNGNALKPTNKKKKEHKELSDHITLPLWKASAKMNRLIYALYD